MSSESDAPRSLREMELEIEVEGREWMRRRLEEKLQAEVTRYGGGFPPERPQSAPSTPGIPVPGPGGTEAGAGLFFEAASSARVLEMTCWAYCAESCWNF